MKQNKSTSKLSAAVFSAISLLAFGCASSDKGVNTAEIIKYNDFNPAQVLLDNNGRHVNAHGAGFLYDNGKYYMFGEHKVGGTVGNRALVGVHCYSSEDLYNWKDEGIALPMSDDPDSEIIRGTVLERPKVIYNPKTKKYVMWMHLEFRKGKFAKSPKLEHILSESPDYRTARVGVAVADKVVGPYKFIRSFRPQAGVYPINDAEKLKAFRRELDAKNPNWRDCDLNKNRPSDEAVARGQFFLRDFEGGQMARDMTLFVDDDGKAYYACASEENATLQIHELSDDFQGFTGRYVRVLRGDYHEAPAFFKKDGKYWLFTSHCTGWAPNPGRISVCDSMLGEWKEIGNPCRGEGQKKSRTRPYSAKPDTTFLSQSTAVIPVQGKKDAFIYVGDRWISEDAIDGRYVFLPVEWENGTPVIRWYDKWDLSIFDKDKK